MRITLLGSAMVLVSALAPAQRNVGITVGGALTTVGAICGFDCSSTAHVGRSVAIVNRTIDVTLYGDAGLPGAIVLGMGPAFGPCPGITLPGIHNGLQILPTNLLVALTAAPLGPSSRLCGTSGSGFAVQQLTVPATASGLVFTWQGLVFDGGTPAFTRPVEMTVR
jgi:hypothetical protein